MFRWQAAISPTSTSGPAKLLFTSARPQARAPVACRQIRRGSSGRAIGGTGSVSLYNPASKSWRQWKLPGVEPRPYAVWVDPAGSVWLSDWSSNSVVRFDPETETFESFPSDRPNAHVRHIDGRKGEAWIPDSGTDRLRVIRYPSNRD